MDELVTALKNRLREVGNKEALKSEVLAAGYTEEEFETAYAAAVLPGDQAPPPLAGPEALPTVETVMPEGATDKKSVYKFVLMLLAGLVVLMGCLLAGYVYLVKAPANKTLEFSSVYCPLPELSPEVLEKKQQLAELELNLLEYEATLPQFDEKNTDYKGQFEQTITWQAGKETLLGDYAKLSAQITKSEYESINPALAENIYQTYCGNEPLVSYQTTQATSSEMVESYKKKGVGELLCSLEAKTTPENEVHEALFMLGFALQQAGDFNRGIDFYYCAAEKYYNPEAMYRLAQLNLYGSDQIVASLNEAGIITGQVTNTVPNEEEALFWISAFFEVVSRLGINESYLSANVVWNATGIIDGLSNNANLTFNRMLNNGKRLMEFMAKKYPEYEQKLRDLEATGTGDVIKYALNNIRVEAELYYDANYSSYAGYCNKFQSDNLYSKDLEGLINFDTYRCADGFDYYIMEAQSFDGTHYCLDSTGSYGDTTAFVGNGMTCSGSSFDSMTQGVSPMGTTNNPMSGPGWDNATFMPESTTGTVLYERMNGLDHVRGNPNAEIVLIEYTDFDCPYCDIFYNTLREVMSAYGETGNIAWVYRHLPHVAFEPNSRKLAIASECVAETAGNDGFWKFTDLIYDSKTEYEVTDMNKVLDYAAAAGADMSKFSLCYEEEDSRYKLYEDEEAATEAGVKAVPHTVVQVGDQTADIYGAQPLETVKSIIDNLLVQMRSGGS